MFSEVDRNPRCSNISLTILLDIFRRITTKHQMKVMIENNTKAHQVQIQGTTKSTPSLNLTTRIKSKHKRLRLRQAVNQGNVKVSRRPRTHPSSHLSKRVSPPSTYSRRALNNSRNCSIIQRIGKPSQNCSIKYNFYSSKGIVDILSLIKKEK